MLTGMVPVTSGDAIVCGHSLVNELDAVRENIGLCPQFDILFPVLTVREHLQFYGHLNNLRGKQLNEEVEGLIKKVNSIYINMLR